MKHALFRRASIPGWLALLLAFAERLYNLIDAWSNIEFLREKLRGWRLDPILFYLSATPVQLALVAVGLIWIAVVATRRPAAALQPTSELQPASAIGDLDMHRRPKRFAEQIRDMHRQVHDPYGHELLRLLDLLRTEIAGNLRYQPSAAERTYLTAVLEHMRASKTENHDPELTQACKICQQRTRPSNPIERRRKGGASSVHRPTMMRLRLCWR